MENSTYKDEFEAFLKESADDFRMVPSRRVWYSIYNNMHPDRKWPSVTVCLLILTAVLYIGVSNNNSLSESARRFNEKNIAAATQSHAVLAAVAKPDRSNGSIQRLRRHLADLSNSNTASGEYDNMPADLDITYVKQNGNAFATEEESGFVADNNRTVFTSPEKLGINVSAPVAEDNGSAASKKTVKPASATTEPSNADIENLLAKKEKADKEEQKEKTKTAVSQNPDKPWIEDYAFRNKPKSAGRQKLSLGYYITPSFGYRAFYKNDGAGNVTSIPNANLKDAAALNLEAGATLYYAATKNLRLKGGMQINYTNYVSKVTTLDHPMQASLAADRDRNTMRYSEYAVKEGVSRLNKTTLQASVPLGADIRILGDNKFKWYLGATIQPTYILSGSAYVLSQDAKNYISETPLLRRWNMNTAVETFVSFRPSTGITLNVGPQFRYQLLSTYKKEYNYSEKLYNIGLKIGVITNF